MVEGGRETERREILPVPLLGSQTVPLWLEWSGSSLL